MSKQRRKPEKGDILATIKTTMGDIKVILFPDAAPKAVENFTTHAKNGYYNGIIFHRVIPDFMIQGGDPLGRGTGGESIWGGSFEDEFSPEYHNLRGALSMANAGPTQTAASFSLFRLIPLTDALFRRWSVCPKCSLPIPWRTIRRSAALRGSTSVTPFSVRRSRVWTLSMP